MSKAEEKYSVTAKFQPFRRSGILFGKEPIHLSADEITEAILNEPMLKVETLKAKPSKLQQQPQSKKRKRKR